MSHVRSQHCTHRQREQDVLNEVVSIAYEILRRRLQPSDAKDVAQDVAFEYLMEIRTGRWTEPAVGLQQAVRRRAMARAVDLLRQEKRRRERQWKYGAEYLARNPAWADPDKTFEERLVMSRFEHALEKLTPACRRIFLMIRQDGMSYGEAAAKLRITESAVNALMVRTGRALRRAFASEKIDVPGLPRDVEVEDAAKPQPPPQEPEPWVVRTVQGLLFDSAQVLRREIARRERG